MHSGISNSWHVLPRLDHARQSMSMSLPSSIPPKLSHDLCIALRLEQCMNIQRLAITQKTASLYRNKFQEVRRYEVQYFRNKHSSEFEFQLIRQRKSCARFAYPEALRSKMICVLQSTNDYSPWQRRLT